MKKAIVNKNENSISISISNSHTQVGGTVGDIESSVFLEALRQFQFRVGRNRMSLVHVTLVPVLGSVGEQKTKPTQQTVRELRSVGLHPDVICCRR